MLPIGTGDQVDVMRMHAENSREESKLGWDLFETSWDIRASFLGVGGTMNPYVVAEGARLTTQEAADKWHTDRRQVSDWCKNGFIPGAKKDRKGNTAWSIPSDARRPIDSKLIQEILWRVLESNKPQRDVLDLTDWGIGLFDTPECIEVLTSSGYIKSAGDGGQVSLTKKGYSILGRYGSSAKDAALPVPLQWISEFGGTFTGCAVKHLIAP